LARAIRDDDPRRWLQVRRALLRYRPAGRGGEGDEGVLEARVAQAAGLPQVYPDRERLGEVEVRTDAVLGLHLLHQPPGERLWLGK
jgi:hypothetical protein